MKRLQKLRTLFRKETLDAEMAEEMRAHLDMQTEQNIARGMSSEEARYAARREFGGVEQIKEIARDDRGIVWLEQLSQDVRYAVRQLRRSPGFACTAITTLALGIGAATAIFSAVNGIVLRPLPYEQPGQLVHVFETQQPGQQNSVSPGAFLDWREHSTAFEGFAAYLGITLNFAGSDEPERVEGVRMSANALHLLRARPILGRVFASDEDQVGKEKVVVLTHKLWQRRFGSDRAVIDRTVLLNNEPYTVIGVLPEGFLPFETQEFVVPLVFPPAWQNLRAGHFLSVMGRLKSGVTVEQADAELQTIRRATDTLHPAWKRAWSTLVVPMQEQLARNMKSPLLVLLAAVALVLLIACANIANLLLARASARQKELTVRAALGASRGRIVRQLLTESILLSLLGGALGVLLAFWGVDALRSVISALGLPRAHEVTLDRDVLAVAFGVAVMTGLGFGLAPALHASRPQLAKSLNDTARGSSAGGRLRSGLIVGEVALALMLLIGVGLFLHSFYRVVSEPTGFDPRNAVAMQITLPLQKYKHNAHRAAFYEKLTADIAALPGVEAAGVSSALSLRDDTPDRIFRILGRADHPEPGYVADYIFCTSGYFRAMGIPLRRGRLFDARQATASARFAIISETMARQYFPNEDPIGRHIGYDKESWEIIGVVGDVRTRGLTGEFQPIVYRLLSPFDAPRDAHLIVRAEIAPAAVVAGVRQTLRDIDPAVPLANVQTLEEFVGASVAIGRLTVLLLALFGGAALLLAAIGLYGVIAYAVTQRTRELGIRFALGATRRHVLGLVFRHGLTLVAFGLLIGGAGALSLARFLPTTFLYQVKPTDPATFAGVSFVLLIVALLAIWMPARRAASVDPMVALRCE
jgi:predicted permease